MAINMDSNELIKAELRLTKTPQSNGLPQQKKKSNKSKRAHNLNDMAVIYGDVGQKQLRQEAVATQIR